MKNIFFTFFILVIFNLPSHADFKPLEEEVVLLRTQLSSSSSINKADLEKSLNLLLSKAKLIENDIAKSDLTGDLTILLNVYVKENEQDNVDSDKVDYRLQHIIDDLAMFRKIGIDK